MNNQNYLNEYRMLLVSLVKGKRTIYSTDPEQVKSSLIAMQKLLDGRLK